jgi:hypothetical protein
MARDKDTRKNFLAWYTQEFGFNTNAATTLHNVQLLKDAKTLSELDNDAIANICKVVSKDTSQSVAVIAVTKLKLACFWIRHQIRTSREIGGTGRPLVDIKYSGTIDLLRQQKQDETTGLPISRSQSIPCQPWTLPPPRRYLTRSRASWLEYVA